MLVEYISHLLTSGRVKAKKDWNWGYIDLSGKVIIPFEYYSIGHFIEGKAKAQKITEVFPSSLGGYSGQLKWGIIDQNGFEIISFIYTHIDDIIDGKAKVKFGEKWGYINDEGKELIPCLYEQLGDFNDGKAKVKKSGKWGIADTNGNIIIQLEYEQIDKFDGDKLSAKKGNKLGIIDFTGKIILPFEYDQINDLIDGEAKVYKENRWGLIDGNGNIIIEDATKIAPGLLKGTKFGKWGIAKIDGKIIIPFEFDEIDDFIDGKIRVKTANHWGVIDENGKVLVEENSEIAPGLFKGKMFGRWGVALTSGAIIIPYEYDVICKIKIGLIKVCLHGKWGVFEANGTQFLPTIYSEIDICSTNKIIKGKKESWGCLDQKGTEILPFLYESVTCSDGKILAIKNKHLETTKYAVVREKVNVSVSAISSFGVFLRFGSIDGLLHISSIVNAGKLISDFKVGDQTQVFIESINEHLQRISFSLLQNNALGIDTLNKHTAFDLCEIGNFYSGKIASIKDYGLFVQLNENIVGLLHISEIKKKNHLLDDYKKGDKIDVLIISLDKVRKRIMLSYYEGN